MSQKIFGFLLVDKPVGWTSFDVCGKLRKKLNIKRIGHTGTLDPFATGLLIVAVGKATKLIPFLEKDRKIYETEILLGKTSETLDTESEIIDSLPEDLAMIPSEKEIETLLAEKFSGKIEQVPPKYSALKIGGKKMCDMARKGEEFEIKSREAMIHSIEILDYNFPVLKLRLDVAAGFYVRSFARDLGELLYGGGLCQQLRRIGIADITIENNSLVLSDMEDDVTAENLISPETIIKLPMVQIEAGRIDDFLQGRAFPLEDKVEGKFMVLSGNRFLGVGEEKCGNLQPRLGFV